MARNPNFSIPEKSFGLKVTIKPHRSGHVGIARAASGRRVSQGRAGGSDLSHRLQNAKRLGARHSPDRTHPSSFQRVFLCSEDSFGSVVVGT